MARCVGLVLGFLASSLLLLGEARMASMTDYLSSSHPSSFHHNLTIFQINSMRKFSDYSSKNCKLKDPKGKSDTSSIVATSVAPRYGPDKRHFGWAIGHSSECNPSGGNCQFSYGTYQVVDLTELVRAQGGGNNNVGNVSFSCNNYATDGGEGVQVHWLKPNFDKDGHAWPAPFSKTCNSTTNRTTCYELEKPLKSQQCGTGYTPVNCEIPLPDPKEFGGALLMSVSGLSLPVADCQAGDFNQIGLGCSIVFVPPTA